LDKVTHVNYSKSGGAGIVAKTLSEYQRNYSKYQSELITKINENHRKEPFVNWKITLLATIDEYLVKNRKSKTMISLYRNISDSEFIERVKTKSTLLHLHWLNGLMTYEDVSVISSNKTPIVWTLHDMEPFTGGCHQALSCQGYLRQCALCPEVKKNYHNYIKSQHNLKFSLKKNLKNVVFVTPSEWLRKKANNSSILGEHRIHLVKNPINNLFFKMSKLEKRRESYGISEKDIVLGFVSTNLNFSLKNYLELKNLVKNLNQFSDTRYILLAIGKIENSKKEDNILEVGYVSSVEEMSEFYQMMDILISVSEAESFGLTVAEAAACRVPALVLAGTGSEEVVRDTKGGASFGDFRDLRNILNGLDGEKKIIYNWKNNICRSKVNQYKVSEIAKKYDMLYLKAIKMVRLSPMR
jgi:glycosyltransferase involved in cell wall biosynthesis